MRMRSCLRARFVRSTSMRPPASVVRMTSRCAAIGLRTRIGAALASRAGNKRRLPGGAHETEGDDLLPAARDEHALDGHGGTNGLGIGRASPGGCADTAAGMASKP